MQFKAVCLFVLAFAMSVFATVFDHPINNDSRPRLVEKLTRLTSHDVISGDFKQVKSIKKLNRDFVSTGTFKIFKTEGMEWNTLKPFPSVLIVNDDGIIQRTPNGPEKKISTSENPVFAEFSKTIQSVFSGNILAIEANFEVFFDCAKDHFSIGLVPREAAVRKVIASIVMEGGENIDKMTILDGDGNPVVYELSNRSVTDNR